jgi:hypothetical protein
MVSVLKDPAFAARVGVDPLVPMLTMKLANVCQDVPAMEILTWRLRSASVVDSGLEMTALKVT